MQINFTKILGDFTLASQVRPKSYLAQNCARRQISIKLRARASKKKNVNVISRLANHKQKSHPLTEDPHT